MQHVAEPNTTTKTTAKKGNFFGKKDAAPFFAPLLVQPKLSIGPVDDPYEREADALADKVMRMTDTESLQTKPSPVTLQRKCAACEEEEKLQRKEDDKEEPIQLKPVKEFDVQRKCTHCEEEEKPVQMKGAAGASAGMAAPAVVYNAINNGGQPLDTGTRHFMESRFGYDFSHVQVHNDPLAQQSASAINALAYTHGNHVVFGAGQYQPGSGSGRRLLAHELGHTIQQGAVTQSRASRASASINVRETIQREVEPESIAKSEDILSKIADTEKKHIDLAKKSGPEAANMVSLGELGFSVFNPGAPGAAGPTNAFVYTCRCGWIDMGHFFVSAAVAYMISILKKVDFKINGDPHTLEELLLKGLDKSSPELALLIDTVPGNQSPAILARVRQLLLSGEPRAISLAFGYGTEFYQQAVKLLADKMKKPPKAMEGEQRSAFTIEDLSSDCYGASSGQKLWRQVSQRQKAATSLPIHDIVQELFKNCRAVYPEGDVRCNMMEETTPGSCKKIPGKDERGTPRQDKNSDAPNLLQSAEPICGKPKPLLCDIGTGTEKSAGEMQEITLDISTRDKSVTVIAPAGSKIAEFFGLQGTTFAKIKIDGTIEGVSKIRLPGIGLVDLSLNADLNAGDLARGELQDTNVHLQSGPLDVDANINISYDGLDRLEKGVFKDEVAKFKAIATSGKIEQLIYDLYKEKISKEEFKDEIIKLVKEKYPEGATVAFLQALDLIVMDIITHVELDVSGTGTLNGLPIFGFWAQKRAPVKIAGYDAPVFRYAQLGVLFPQFLRGKLIQQFPLALGYTENWLVGDPRPGGPNANFSITGGIGLPQSELFLEGAGSLTTDTGFQLKAGFHLAPVRFGPREAKKPDLLFNPRVPEDFYQAPQWNTDKRTGPLSAYISAGNRTKQLKLEYTMGPDGEHQAFLSFGGSHTLLDSK